MVNGELRAPALVCVALAALACGSGESQLDATPRSRAPGELALPPSANAPRVSRDASPPDTFHPDSVDEFEIVNLDSFAFAEPGLAGPDPSMDALTDAYRRHYAEALDSEGSAVRGGIDRQIQQEAERRTAEERGFGDWTTMIEALTPEQRAGLVNRLNAANIELANELHGTGKEIEGDPIGTAPVDEQEPLGTSPTGR